MSKLLIRNICQPPDSNPYGTAHGAWIVKQMAHGGIYMTQLVSKGNAVLVESKVKYKNPMHVGKFINVYGSIVSVKQSKMIFKITAMRSEMNQNEVEVAVSTSTITWNFTTRAKILYTTYRHRPPPFIKYG